MRRFSAPLALAIAVTSHAFAQPPGVVSVEGGWQTESGQPLFFYNAAIAPTEPSLCGGQCTPEIAQAIGRFTLVTVDDGVELAEPWERRDFNGEAALTYRGKVMLTFSGDLSRAANYPFGSVWQRAPDVESLRPIPASDPSITQRAVIDHNRSSPAEYPWAAWKANETGQAVLSLCIRPEGRVIWADIVQSSGSRRLDDASLKHALQGMVLTPAIVGDSAVAVCGVIKNVAWTLNSDEPSPPPPVSN